MKMLTPLPGPDACAACRYYAASMTLAIGKCRLRAPVIHPLMSDCGGRWPVTARDDLCGEFKRAFIEASADHARADLPAVAEK